MKAMPLFSPTTTRTECPLWDAYGECDGRGYVWSARSLRFWVWVRQQAGQSARSADWSAFTTPEARRAACRGVWKGRSTAHDAPAQIARFGTPRSRADRQVWREVPVSAARSWRG